MKMRRIAHLAIAILAFATPLAAQQSTQPLTLKDCIDYSVVHHPLLKAANYGIKVSEQQSVEALSYYLPQISGTGTVDDNLKRMTTVIPAGSFSPQPLKVQFGNQYTTNFFVQVDQVVFDKSLLTSIKANEPNKAIANYQKDKTVQQVAYNTAVAYYNVLIQKERLSLLSQNETKLAELLRITRAQYEKGLIQKLDVDRIQVNYNNTTTQMKSVQMAYNMALNQLKTSMGYELSAPLSIDESLNYDEMVAGNVALDSTIYNTMDYKIQQQSLMLNEIDLDRKKAALLPSLSAYARYGAQTFGNNFGDQFNSFYNYSVVGLRLNVPVFSSMRRYSQIKQSELNLYSAKEQFNNVKNNLEMQVLNAYTALESAQNNLESNKENLDLAQSVFDATNVQYQVGMASLSDLLNSEFAFKEAQNQYISSLLSYSISRLDYEKARGGLTEYINQLN
ncbi:TolC family protein [bacterium]|nr:TolC family protein [bacterium]